MKVLLMPVEQKTKTILSYPYNKRNLHFSSGLDLSNTGAFPSRLGGSSIQITAAGNHVLVDEVGAGYLSCVVGLYTSQFCSQKIHITRDGIKKTFIIPSDNNKTPVLTFGTDAGNYSCHSIIEPVMTAAAKGHALKFNTSLKVEFETDQTDFSTTYAGNSAIAIYNVGLFQSDYTGQQPTVIGEW